tara:strand:- start:782 stop:988 length:207 start_codon:yes stop_codon:yes gene_type:complete
MNLKDKLESGASELSKGLNGKLPKGALKADGVIPINGTFDEGRYQDYLVNADRAIDLTDSDSVSRTQG